MRKKAISAALAASLLAVSLAACGGSAASGTPSSEAATGEAAGSTSAETTVNEDLSGELVFAIWDNNLMEYIDQNDMVGKFQEHYPNAEIEVEKIKDDSEY